MKMARATATRCAGLFALLALLVTPAAAAGQSAEEVVDRALERQDERLSDVEDCTTVWRHEGPSTTSLDTVYLVKKTVAGHTALLPADTEGQPAAGFAARLYDEFAQSARHEGTATVSGRDAHVLVVDDPAALERWSREMFRPMFERGESPVEEVSLQEASAYFDAERDLLLKTRFVFEASRDGEGFSVEAETLYEDYREDQGLLRAHRLVNRTIGLAGAMPPQQLEKAREALRKMEQMPEDRRKMMEAYMGDRLEKWREMLKSGTMEVTRELVELRVNEGPPGGP